MPSLNVRFSWSRYFLDHEAGSRDIRILSGMRQLFPKMNLVMTIAALSMAGVPFLNGF